MFGYTIIKKSEAKKLKQFAEYERVFKRVNAIKNSFYEWNDLQIIWNYVFGPQEVEGGMYRVKSNYDYIRGIKDLRPLFSAAQAQPQPPEAAPESFAESTPGDSPRTQTLDA